MADELTDKQVIKTMVALWEDEYSRQRAKGMRHGEARAFATKELKRAYPTTALWMEAAMSYRTRGGEKSKEAAAGLRLTANLSHVSRQLRANHEGRAVGDETPAPTTQEPSGNGIRKRQMPGLVTYDSGTSNVTETIIGALSQMELKPGDRVHFGNIYLWSFIVGCSPSAIPSLIQGQSGQSALTDAGYVFNTQNKSYHNFIATVTAAPKSAKDKEIEEIKSQITELMARLNSM